MHGNLKTHYGMKKAKYKKQRKKKPKTLFGAYVDMSLDNVDQFASSVKENFKKNY